MIRVSSLIEALKAQTVAARTYMISNLGQFSENGYDVCDTPACQVYRGAGTEHPMTDRAIEETRGLVLSFRGSVEKSVSGGELTGLVPL